MGDHEDGGVHRLSGLEKAVDDSARGFAVEIARRFVGEDHQRLIDERAGHRCALFFAAGDLRRIFVADMRQPKHLAKLVGARFHLVVDARTDDRRQENILAHRKPIEQQKILENKAKLFIAHISEGFLVQLGELRVAEQNTAGI